MFLLQRHSRREDILCTTLQKLKFDMADRVILMLTERVQMDS